jgi:hypothetical protein
LPAAARHPLQESGGVWFGWSGEVAEDPTDEPRIAVDRPLTFATLDLSRRDYDEYYLGYANRVLWPLFHYRSELVEIVSYDLLVALPIGGSPSIGSGLACWPETGDTREVLPKFREMAREAGRDPASIEITSFALGEDLDRVKRLKEMGVARVVPMFPPDKADKVLPIVDRWAKIIKQING